MDEIREILPPFRIDEYWRNPTVQSQIYCLVNINGFFDISKLLLRRQSDVKSDRILLSSHYYSTLHSAILGSNLLGPRIVIGDSRVVFESLRLPNLVLKIERRELAHRSPSFANIGEWNTWRMWENTERRRWLAPIICIDEWGTALVQTSTRPVPDEIWYKTQVPVGFSDGPWQRNFGLLGSRLVCHDYASFGRKDRAGDPWELRPVRPGLAEVEPAP
jgi:hypothetical protein